MLISDFKIYDFTVIGERNAFTGNKQFVGMAPATGSISKAASFLQRNQISGLGVAAVVDTVVAFAGLGNINQL